jgi:putative NIF3 family GTP cyclohydrolase 1 type 2
MKLNEVYHLAIEMGIKADPRSEAAIKKELEKAQKAYDKLDAEEKEFFDTDYLFNPYPDSRILNGNPESEVSKVYVGVDIDSGEIAVADALNQRGAGIDLIIAHHPEGSALADLPKVLEMQIEYMKDKGVWPHIAESMMAERIKELDGVIGVRNHNRSVQAAELLGFNYMCLHTPTDNLANDFLEKYIEEKKPETIGDLCKIIRDLPEYTHSAKHHNPVRVICGSKENSVGKVHIWFTGGTSGHKDNMKALSAAGISTIISMHATEREIEAAKEARLNLVIAGHIASDNLGINLLLDQLEARGVEAITCSGVVRVKRN